MHLLSYLDLLILECETFRTKFADKIKKKKHFLCSGIFFFENREIMCRNNVERGRPQMAIWRMRIACWMTKVTNAHIQVVHCKSGCTNAPQYYVIRTLPVLFAIV